MSQTNPLEQFIEQDFSAAEQLVNLLLQEREALENRNREQLQQILEEKLTPMQILERNAQQRAQLLQENGYSNNNSGWLLLLADRQQHRLIPRWQQVTELVKKGKEANETNGKLIARNRQTLDKLLSLLRGQTSAPSLYTNAGKTNNQTLSHTLIKA